MPFYVYKITNLKNGKIYVGKAVNIKKRWSKHKTAAKRQDPNDFSYLHRAMLKHGFDNFSIEELAVFTTEEKSLIQEIAYIEKLGSRDRNIGYNLTEGGEGSSGFKHTDESKQKMSEIKKLTYIGENNPFFGKAHTKEAIELMSQIASQRIGDKNPFYGKEHSEESIDLQRENHHDKEKIFTEEDIQKMRYKKQVLKMTYKELAKEYGVYWKTISNAINGRRAYSK